MQGQSGADGEIVSYMDEQAWSVDDDAEAVRCAQEADAERVVADILRSASAFSDTRWTCCWVSSGCVQQHHERLDGSGYPDGLCEDELLLEANVLAVADVVEAMASHRPYRPALGVDAALEEVSRNAGRLYDRAVVDSCVRVPERATFAF